MSSQRLGPAKLRKLSRITGMDVLRAWANGGYVYNLLVIPDGEGSSFERHEHWAYDLKTTSWERYPGDGHFSTCWRLIAWQSDPEWSERG